MIKEEKEMTDYSNEIHPLWKSGWDSGNSDWHYPRVNPHLQKHFERMTGNANVENKRILVPLCGKTHDMKWLYDQGMVVVGIEVFEMPCQDFFKEHKLEYKVIKKQNAYGTYNVYEHDSRLKIYQGNIFHFKPSVFDQQFDFIWDRGSLEAMEIDNQQRYVDNVSAMLKDKALGLLRVCEYDAKLLGTAPFPLFNENLVELFCDVFEFEEIARNKYGELEGDVFVPEWEHIIVIYRIKKIGDMEKKSL